MDMLKEYVWFAVNALLVAGLVGLGVFFQSRQDDAQPSSAGQESPVGQVEMSTSSRFVIEASVTPKAGSAAPAPAPASSPRPHIIGGEYDDDD